MNNKFEPCPDCKKKKKTNENCSICADTGDDYYFSKDYSPSQPWNAPGMGLSDFIR